MLLMARKKTSNESGKEADARKSTAVQVEKDLARKIQVICGHRGISQWELISPAIREYIELQYALVSGEIQQEVKHRKASGQG
ncbi:MAG TPA: hypothetical protein VN641_11110 [Urbifossiella sp.]|nr:hypothetical protein [Urbifossiella sp.]